MLVTIASEIGGATLMVRPHFFHPSNQVALCSQAVTPGQVADYVREARRATSAGSGRACISVSLSGRGSVWGEGRDAGAWTRP